MPKLPKDAAKAAQEAETSGFDPLPPGIYPFTLMDVQMSENKGASGYHYWRCEFSCEHPNYRNRKVWANLSLSPKAAFKMKEFLESFVEPGSDLSKVDTDELLGDPIDLQLRTVTIQAGSREGELTNEVAKFMPHDPSRHDSVEGDADDEPF